jgi:UDP-N-acetyl-D-mannosaminuronic acid dehydrogenase
MPTDKEITVENTRICVIGLGYIGLPTSAILATKGYSVLGVDISPEVVATINSGKIHIEEPDLDILVKSAVQSGRLTAATTPRDSDVYIICVPTPFKDNHQPDLSYVDSAVDSILPVIKKGDLVILESTSPVGTSEHIAQRIEKANNYKTGTDFYVAHCPERVLPGHILREAIENDRVIGGVTEACTQRTLALYQSFVHGTCHATTASTAEMVKLVENSFRDVNIAFANELSLISHRLKINVWDVIRLANCHPRVKILNPGPGVGGHCIAIDPWFIVASAPEESRLIRTARQVNDSKPHFVVERAREMIQKHGKPLGVLGLTFKANVDDFRESPSFEIAQELTKIFGKDAIRCHDPFASAQPKMLSGLNMMDLNPLVETSHSLLLLVDHKEYKSLAIRRDQGFYDTRGFIQR